MSLLGTSRQTFDPVRCTITNEAIDCEGFSRSGRPKLFYVDPDGPIELGAPIIATEFFMSRYLLRWLGRFLQLVRPDVEAEDRELKAYKLQDVVAKHLLRDFRGGVDLPRLRRALKDAFALDSEVLQLALQARWRARGPVCTQYMYSRVWQHPALYREVRREAPNLLWVLDYAIGDGLVPPAGRVLASLKEAFLADGLGERSWRLLARSRRRDFDLVLQKVRGRVGENIVAWLKLHEKLDLNEMMPHAFQLELLRQVTDLQADEVATLDLIEEWLDLDFLKLAAREAISRRRAGTLGAFVLHELGLGFRWEAAADRKTLLRNGNFDWETVMRRASRWKEAEDRRLAAGREHWVSALGVRHYGDFDVVPLSDSFMLWLEGMEMHHCANRFTKACLDGSKRMFSIRSAASGRRLATLLIGRGPILARGGRYAWQVSSLKGFANAPVRDALARLGQQVACDYADADPTRVELLPSSAAGANAIGQP